MEKRRERALHNLRMPKNISDTLACGSAPLLCFIHILTSSVIYFWTDPRNMESHCLTILVKFRCTLDWNWAMSRLLKPTYPTFFRLYLHCSFLSQCFVTGVYLQMSDKWIDIGEGLTWQVFQQMWRVLSVAIFLLMMIFALLVQRKTWSQIYAIRFLSVMQACLTITANFAHISWFSRLDKFMKPLPTILSLGP